MTGPTTGPPPDPPSGPSQAPASTPAAGPEALSRADPWLPPLVIDGHVHVFRAVPAATAGPPGARGVPAHPGDAPQAAARGGATSHADRSVPRTVDALAPAVRSAPVDDLLTRMRDAGVHRAVLVPLGPLPGDDAYLADALDAHPDRFTAVAVADAAVQGRTDRDPVSALRERRDLLPFRALRTQWLGDPGRDLADSPMLPVLRELAGRGEPLWSYLSPDQLGLLEQLPHTVPDLVVVLNHLGFLPHGMRVDAHRRPTFHDPFPGDTVRRVARLARHPGTYLMFSGQYALSRTAPPHPDLAGAVRLLADAYGARRMLWASDHPWTRDVPGYRTLLSLPALMLPGASRAELAAVLGGTAASLFPGWPAGAPPGAPAPGG